MDADQTELPALGDVLSQDAMGDLPMFILVSAVEEEKKHEATPLMQDVAAVINERYGQEHLHGRGSYMWVTKQAANEIPKTFALTDDVTIVFEEFDESEGSFFRYVVAGNRDKQFPGRPAVIGPWILSNCLTNLLQFPKSIYAMWSLSMHGIVISFSGLDSEGPNIDAERKKLKAKVHRMGGLVTREFNADVTHLVCDSSKKEKYKVARERRLPIMKQGWINAVYADSLDDPSVNARAAKYDCFRFRCFDGLVITLSQIPRPEKAVLSRIILENGGKVIPELRIKETDFLVAGSPSGEKVMAAANARIEVLKSSWVHDCSSCGYLLDPAEYRVIRKKTSTPTKNYNDRSLFEASRFSEINDTHTLASITIQETQFDASCSVDDFRSSERSDNVGASLSGSRIFIYGSKQATHWKKIIRAAGGVVCGDLNDDVTHVVAEIEGDNQASVAQAVTQLLRAYPGANPVSVTTEWLKRCIDENSHVDETNFLLHAPRTSVVPPSTFKTAPQHSQGEPKIARQASASMVSRHTELVVKDGGGDQRDAQSRRSEDSEQYTGTMEEEDSEFFRNFADTLRGKRVMIIDDRAFDDEDSQNICSIVSEYGAVIMPPDATEVADLAFVFIDTEDPQPPSVDLTRLRAREFRTNLWLNDCLEQRELAPVHYYHRPLPAFVYQQRSLLDGCVIVPTSFGGAQREYLKVLATALGGVCSELLSRRDNPEKGYRACTHLIAKSPEGQKYERAVDWGVHTVSVEWLVKSAFQRTRLPEADYPVLALGNDDDGGRVKEIDEYVAEQLQSIGCYGLATSDSCALQLSASAEKENQIPDVPESQDAEDDADATLREPIPDTEPLPAAILNAFSTSVTSPNVSRRRTSSRHTPVAEPVSTPVAVTRGLSRNQSRPTASGRQWGDSRKRGFAETSGSDTFQEYNDGPRKPKRIVPNSQIWQRHHQRAREAFQGQEAPPASPASMTYSRKYRLFDQRRDEVIRTYNEEGRTRVPRPLTGEVLMIVGKRPDVVSRYADVAAELGAVCVADYDDSITYVVVHEDSRSDPIVKTAEADCKFLVSHHWLDRCREEGAHVPAAVCPWYYVKTPPMDDSFQEIPAAASGSKGVPGSKRVPIEIQREPRPIAASQQDEDSEDPNLRDDMRRLAEMADAKRTSSRRPSDIPPVASFLPDSQPSGSDNPRITWHDPVATRTMKSVEALVRQPTQRAKPLTMMHMNASYLTESEPEALPETVPLDLPVEESLPPPEPERVFSFSKLDRTELQTVQKIVERLGGRIVDSRSLADGMTHFLTTSIARSEKALGMIAAGAWILHTSYIYDCDKTGKYLPEADYEWGSPNLEEAASKLGAEKDLAKSARFWRAKREAEGRSNSFSQFKVTIHAGTRSGSFERIMKAGGATIVKTALPLKESDDVNLIVAEGKDLESIDIPAMAVRSIPVVNPQFTALHLSSCGNKPLSDSYAKEYAEVVRKLALKK